MFNQKRKVLLLILFSIVLFGCSKTPPPTVAQSSQPSPSATATSSNVPPANATNTGIVVNTSKTNTENENVYEVSWMDRGYGYLNKYMEPRMAQCGNSYFLLIGKTGLYETKKEPFVEIFDERIYPAEALSEADRLNGKKKAVPERWQGRWRIKIESPWRYFRGNRWDSWRNDTTTKDYILNYTAEEKWEVGQSWDGGFQKIGKFRCVGNDIDIESIPDGPNENKTGNR